MIDYRAMEWHVALVGRELVANQHLLITGEQRYQAGFKSEPGAKRGVAVEVAGFIKFKQLGIEYPLDLKDVLGAAQLSNFGGGRRLGVRKQNIVR